MKKSVFLTRRLPEPAMRKLGDGFDVQANDEDRVLTKEEVMDGVKGKDALLCLLTDTIDAEVMDQGPALRIISNYAVGYNNIRVEEATKRGIVVANTPGVLTETTADLAWALLMTIARRIVEADRFTRAGKFKGWGPLLFLGADIHHKTIGIIGLGRIGYAVARRAKGFGMRILYTDSERSPEKEAALEAAFVDLPTLLKASDFITLHAPALPSTRHLIGAQELSLMKPTAYLINTARGALVDEAALLEALKEKRIAGAALDVYEEEPRLTPGLEALENVVLVPHIASATSETRTKMGLMAVENMLAVFQGRRPENFVNPEVWKQRRYPVGTSS